MSTYTKDTAPPEMAVVSAAAYARRPVKGLTREDLAVGRFADRVEQRFMERVVEDPAGCWVWRGTKHSSTGAPVFRFGKSRSVIATRAAVVLFGGVELDPGDVVRHRSRPEGCDALCVNPDHLHVVRGGGRK